MTLPEVVLWQALRRNGTGYCFRHQHPVGPYVLDFFCAKAKLAIEVDGAAHDIAAQVAHDDRRAAWLAERGIEQVVPTIIAICAERCACAGRRPLHRASRGPPPPLRG